MQTTIANWGNSLAVRIPKPFALQAGIFNGGKIELTLINDQIILAKPKKNLKSLLKKITPDNIHQEINTGDITGKEIW